MTRTLRTHNRQMLCAMAISANQSLGIWVRLSELARTNFEISCLQPATKAAVHNYAGLHNYYVG